MCLCAPHVCRYLWRPEEGIGSPGARVVGSSGPPDMGAVEGNSSPLQKQQRQLLRNLSSPHISPFSPKGNEVVGSGALFICVLYARTSQQLEGALWMRMRTASFGLGSLSPVAWEEPYPLMFSYSFASRTCLTLSGEGRKGIVPCL